jgi:large subunit ribosomal protein L7/L12
MSESAKENLKLEALRKRETQIKAQITKLVEQEKMKSRKDDTRLKVLIGAAFLADAAIYPETCDIIKLILQRAITSQRDREFLTMKGWL